MSTPQKHDVIVVGAGLAGLACAIRLKNKGKQVLVLERNDRPGGKIEEFDWLKYRWDRGPSLLTEPELIDELFLLCGEKPEEYFKYEQLSESCRYFFPDNTSTAFYSSREKTTASLQAIASSEQIEKVNAYLSESENLYQSFGDFFLSRPQPKWKNLFDNELIKRYPSLLKKSLRSSLHKYNVSQLENEKLIQIFDRFGTYNGSNPYQMSGLYSMIPYLEQIKGAYFPKNGMRSIIDSLYQLGLKQGVEFRFNEDLTGKKTSNGYLLSGEENYACEQLVCAIDPITFYEDVMNYTSDAEKYKRQEPSSSGLVFYWAMDTVVEQLGVHNILFSQNYEQEFDQIFNQKALPTDPTFYIHISSVVNPGDAPEYGQNWFIMINTPAGTEPDEAYKKRIKKLLITRIKEQFNIDIEEAILFEDYWDSAYIGFSTGSYKGALYGASSNKLTSSLVRHGNTHPDHKDMYFCGGAVHPGGGIPLVLRSAKIVDSLIT